MKIKLLEQITGTRNNVAWPASGDTIDLPDHEAARLCASGRAEPVVEDRTEKAVAPQAETRESTAPVSYPPAPLPEKRESTKRTRTRAPRDS